MNPAGTDTLPRLHRSGNEGHLILRDGRALHFMEFGRPDGVPAFGFHGTPGSRFMFRLADPAASRLGLRLIAPERPGFGLSSFQKRRKLSDWASDMRELADALGIDRFAVAGVSGGGPYAAACAALMPERVLAAALVSPMGPVRAPEGATRIGAMHHSTFRLFPTLPVAMGALFSVGRAGFLHAPLAIYSLIMSRVSPSDWKILSRKDVRLNLLEGVAEGVRPGVRGAVEEMRIFAKPWKIPFENITAPCFLWQGTADRNVPVQAAFRLGELIPNCKVRRLEGSGHYWIFDHMDEVLETVRAAAEARLSEVPPAEAA